MILRRAAPATPSRLVLDGTFTHGLAERRTVAVITFWMQFHNAGPGALHNLALLCGTLTDGSGAELEYDEAPVTVVGRPEQVVPGAGFVAVAHYTVAVLRAPRVLRHSIVLRGRTGEGRAFTDVAALEVYLDPRRSPGVRFSSSSAGPRPSCWR